MVSETPDLHTFNHGRNRLYRTTLANWSPNRNYHLGKPTRKHETSWYLNTRDNIAHDIYTIHSINTWLSMLMIFLIYDSQEVHLKMSWDSKPKPPAVQPPTNPKWKDHEIFPGPWSRQWWVNAFQGSFSEVRLCGAYSQLLDPFATCFCCISPRNLILWIPFQNHLGSFDFWRKTLGKHLVIAPRFVVMVIQSLGNILQDSDACNFLEIWKKSKQTFRIYLRRGQKITKIIQGIHFDPFWKTTFKQKNGCSSPP